LVKVSRQALRRGLVLIAFNAIVSAAIVEGVLLLMLHVPGVTRASPRAFRRLIQQTYRHFNRALIQFDPDCAQYDTQVTYTLKPGNCTFENIEFRNQFHINHLGLRDDEASLAGPEIIVLGDSHAMGWGVEQDQTLVRVLARRSGMKVLNAAISSYGTVREKMLLDRLDVSHLRYLVLQYSDNDVVENRAFKEHGDRLPITGDAEYLNITRYYASQRSYYPGKYIYRLFMKVLRLETPEPDQTAMPPTGPAEEVDLFINALAHAGRVPLDDVQLIVFEINEALQQRRPFLTALQQAQRSRAVPSFVQRLLVLDAASLLTPNDFYALDDHMNAHGHQVIGEALAEVVRSRSAKVP
jgi:hypothetical protein